MNSYGIILLFCQATSVIAAASSATRFNSLPFVQHGEKLAEEIRALLQIGRGGSTMIDDESNKSLSSPLFSLSPNSTRVEEEKLYIQKRNGSLELLDEEKVREHADIRLHQEVNTIHA